MNEKFSKLADQCRTLHRDGYGGYVEQFDEEKFAELIVRECMNAIYDVDDLGGYHFKAVNAVKQHFGVEE